MGKRTIKTKIEDIVAWGKANIDECGYGVDVADMSTHCWRCGHNDVGLERAHVIPDSLGGPDIPSNYRLLCAGCHAEAPNVDDPDEMDNWIRSTCISVYNRFWPMREILDEEYEKASWHFGQRTMNNSTRRWIYEQVKKRYLERFYPDKDPDDPSTGGWYLGLFPKSIEVKD